MVVEAVWLFVVVIVLVFCFLPLLFFLVHVVVIFAPILGGTGLCSNSLAVSRFAWVECLVGLLAAAAVVSGVYHLIVLAETSYCLPAQDSACNIDGHQRKSHPGRAEDAVTEYVKHVVSVVGEGEGVDDCVEFDDC